MSDPAIGGLVPFMINITHLRIKNKAVAFGFGQWPRPLQKVTVTVHVTPERPLLVRNIDQTL
jgi:hypothetical protein